MSEFSKLAQLYAEQEDQQSISDLINQSLVLLEVTLALIETTFVKKRKDDSLLIDNCKTLLALQEAYFVQMRLVGVVLTKMEVLERDKNTYAKQLQERVDHCYK